MKVIEQRSTYYDFLVHWSCFNKVVCSFLSHTPLIFRDRRGLSAIGMIDRDNLSTQTDTHKIHRSMWTPGLHQLYLVSQSGWQVDKDFSPPQTTLIDLKDVGDWHPRVLQALRS